MMCVQGRPTVRNTCARRIILFWPPVFLLLFLVAFCMASCSNEKKKEQKAEPIPVVLGKARQVGDYRVVELSGSITAPDAPANLSFLIPGKVVFVGPREGEYVRKGQRLASIDGEDYRLGLEAAAAQRGQARVAARRAEEEFNRMKSLYESKSLAPNDFEKFRAARDAAVEQLGQAIAQENLARKRLSDVHLVAPLDGYISRRSVALGEMASPARPAFEIVRLDPVEVSIDVPEKDVPLLRVGQKAIFTLPAIPNRSFEGRVRVVNVAADPATRTYMARISVPNPGQVLKPGMVADAAIRTDRRMVMTTLPAEAIVRDPRGATLVFVADADQKRVYAKRVRTGALRGRDIEIREGLRGDEEVVLAGQDRLRDGMAVKVASGQTVMPQKKAP